ncbi:response regulator [Oculatella sp. LEGE 06141]|uniref:ATP-binding response regulator n=1 Tax=Oculatella sp. LEGE 06141 TaxID=1828648 RepID=UPI0018826B41|nr:hybrid sensor histidine kinase/response regulator [Oculatella sp. LEGE 06141]MBE9178405.1 response regulator [Oculatella sp. LEGE 06141]
MSALCLREFIAPVPVCTETASLATVLELLRQTGSDHAVMLNDAHHPVGMIGLQKLLFYLFEDHASIDSGRSTTADPRLQQRLKCLATEMGQPLLDPVGVLPAHWTLSQFYPYLRQVEQEQWAVVDAAGGFLGLLNRLRLLRFLAAHPDPAEGQDGVAPSGELNQASAAAAFHLEPLIALLERLPLPIMLQTHSGRAIAQNLAWRQQVGEMQDPVQIRQEAAQLLGTMAPATFQPDSQPAREGDRDGVSGAALQSVLPPPAMLEPEATSLGWCQPGQDADSCVCICPMKNGSDRVWQLVKIPLEAIVSLPTQSSPVRRGLQSASSQAHFQLATLGFSADPTWTMANQSVDQSVDQTESLWLVVAQDTTEPQQVAKELAAKNADLVQLNRLKDEFLACISHELKTPLTAILGLSSLLREQTLGALNDRQKRYADLIHQSGRHLVLIVNDILDLTRIETGEMELTLEPVQIEDICQQAYHQALQLQPLDPEGQIQKIGWQAIDFHVKRQPGLETLMADEMRLRQMLVNLLSNALKFTEPSGKIGLTVEAWEGWLAFTVWDTGIGIPTDRQHLIFQKGEPLANPLTRHFEGTGLGLVLTQRLAWLHGGDVTFTSVEGEGSHFTLLLPPHPPATSARFKAKTIHLMPPTSTPIRNRLAIVAEAVPPFCQALTRHLTELGYRVAIARSGTEAIEKIRRLQPGVVFLNPLLPLLSGWDVLTLLKTDDDTCSIPILVTASPVEKVQALRNGASGFLSLPIQAEALQLCLEQLTAPPEPGQPLDAVLNITVLHLRVASPEPLTDALSPPIADLNEVLFPYRCRVLEVDDLDQADLLTRVWKPDLVLFDSTLADPLSYLKQLSQYPFLAAVPLVTLTAETTQAANQVVGLSVFPCLARTSAPPGSSTQPDPSALLQVMEVAAGLSWSPHVLIVEASMIQADWAIAMNPSVPTAYPAKTAEWLQACAQYVQAAGLRSSIGYSWSEVLQQLQHQSVDGLLICLGQSAPHPSALSALPPLEQLSPKPPILLWQSHAQESAGDDSIPLMWQRLGAIATRILPPSVSMSGVVNELDRLLTIGSKQ